MNFRSRVQSGHVPVAHTYVLRRNRYTMTSPRPCIGSSSDLIIAKLAFPTQPLPYMRSTPAFYQCCCPSGVYYIRAGSVITYPYMLRSRERASKHTTNVLLVIFPLQLFCLCLNKTTASFYRTWQWTGLKRSRRLSQGAGRD